MKFSKKMTKFFAITAIGAMLFGTTVYAATTPVTNEVTIVRSGSADDDAEDASKFTINADDKVLYVGDSFDVMGGVTAFNNKNGKVITDQVASKGKVNTGVAGVYKVTYYLVNNPDVTKKITVTVKDIPEIVKPEVRNAVLNVTDKNIAVGSAFDIMAGVTATDDGGQGADITANVVYSGVVNTGAAGTYKVTYEVIGSNGERISKTVNIVVGSSGNCTTTPNTTCYTPCTPECNTTVNTTCAPVNTTCVPVNTTCAPVNTTCYTPCTPACNTTTTCDTTEEVCDTTEVVCEVPEDTTCVATLPISIDPIRIIVDPIKVELINTTCDPDTDDTDYVDADTTDNNIDDEQPTMRPTGANIGELVLSATGLLGAIGTIIRRKF